MLQDGKTQRDFGCVNDFMNATMVKDEMGRARQYIKAHLKECCSELLVWHDTAELPTGHLRTAARFLQDEAIKSHALSHAESITSRLAWEHIANT